MSFETAALVGAWVALALLGLALSGVMRQVSLLARGERQVMRRIGPTPGALIPDDSSLTQVVPAGMPALVLFVDANCAGCTRLFEPGRRDDWMQHMVGVPVVLAEVHGAPATAHEVAESRIVADKGLLDDWNIEVTPIAVIISSTGTVVEATVVGSAASLSDFLAMHITGFRVAGREDSLIGGRD